MLKTKSCISKLKESEEHLINVYKTLGNNDVLSEQLKSLQEQFDELNEELENSKKKSEKNFKNCISCIRKEEALAQLEKEIKVQCEKSAKLVLEIEQNKSVKDLKKEEVKLNSETTGKVNVMELSLSSKENEILRLKSEIVQRDALLEKARNLVITLNKECTKKTVALQRFESKEFEEIDSKTQWLVKENQQLKESFQVMQKNFSDLDCNKVDKAEKFSADCYNSTSNEKIVVTSQIENDITYLENELAEVSVKLVEISSENTRLNECIRNLELKYLESQQEKVEISNNLVKAHETIENLRHQKNQLEIELQKVLGSSKFNQSIEDLSKLLMQKESTISELTSQVLMKTHKHKKHRHNSFSRDVFEIFEAVKREIVGGKENQFEFCRETMNIFKEFQGWYRSFTQKKRNFGFYEEILVFLMEIFKGKAKEDIRELLEKLNDLENDVASKQILGFIKSACSGKQEISAMIKELNSNLGTSIESIGVVTNKLQEIRRKVPRDENFEFSLKVVDLSLGFLKSFRKEREIDLESSCKMIRIIGMYS